jgi:N-acyl-L-homoserine lactone synthetase
VSNLEDDMAILVEASHREAAADLLNSSFELRHRILVQRLGWQLPSGQAPRETDAFDAGHTCHLISRTHDGRVRGTMRLTPSLAPNVTCDVLQSQIPIPFPRAAHIVECSRLCVDLDMPSSERFAARADLFLSQLEMCERFGWTHTIGVLLQSVLQYFIRAGLAVPGDWPSGAPDEQRAARPGPRSKPLAHCQPGARRMTYVTPRQTTPGHDLAWPSIPDGMNGVQIVAIARMVERVCGTAAAAS